MLSNTLTITVVPPVSPPPNITSVKLISGTTKVKVGKQVTLYVDVTFDRKVSDQDALNYGVMVDVYVNGKKIKSLTYALQEGSNKWSGSFTLAFQKPGKYIVQADVNLYRKTSVAQPE